MGEVGSVMEGGLAPVVEGVQRDAVLEQDVDHHVLAVVAGNVEWGATIGVDGIRLKGWNMCKNMVLLEHVYL